MKESEFIAQNTQKWGQFEKDLREEAAYIDAARLQEIFVQLTDDLSYSRTFYPNRKVTAYLNDMAQSVFTTVYRKKPQQKGRWHRFFWSELPQIIYESRWAFYVSTALFVLSFIIGYFSAAKDSSFTRLILGEHYIQMTLENIKKGDPMAVYKDPNQLDMTFGIMINNIFVCYYYFLLGITAGIGTVAKMMYNGVMVGVFLQFFAARGLLGTANLAIWMHGVLEISAIIIGSAAGLLIGQGLLFPATYTRLQSFQIAARKGLKIMVAVTLMLVVAALIEGNITRLTEVPDVVRGAFIGLCLVLVVWYYFVYPAILARRGAFEKRLDDLQLPPDLKDDFEWLSVRTAARVVSDSFSILKEKIGIFARYSFIFAAIYTFFTFFVLRIKLEKSFGLSEGFFDKAQYLVDFFSINPLVSTKNIVDEIITVGYLSVLMAVFYFVLMRVVGGFSWKGQLFKQAFVVLVGGLATVLLLRNDFPFIFIFLYPLIIGVMLLQFRNEASSVYQPMLFGSPQFLVSGSFWIMLSLAFLVMNIANTRLTYEAFETIGWNLQLNERDFDGVMQMMLSFFNTFILFLLFFILNSSIMLSYFSKMEERYGITLRDNYQTIGRIQRIKGLARD